MYYNIKALAPAGAFLCPHGGGEAQWQTASKASL